MSQSGSQFFNLKKPKLAEETKRQNIFQRNEESIIKMNEKVKQVESIISKLEGQLFSEQK